MKEKEFIQELEDNLFGIPKKDLEDLLGDYREHFRIGKKDKRNEEEIARSLGDPRDIARDIKRELNLGRPNLIFALEESAGRFARYSLESFKKYEKYYEKNPRKAIFISLIYFAVLFLVIQLADVSLGLLFSFDLPEVFIGAAILFVMYKFFENRWNLNGYLKGIKPMSKKKSHNLKSRVGGVKFIKARHLWARYVGVLMFNLFIMISLIVTVFALSLSGIVTGGALFFSGLAVLVASIVLVAAPGVLILETLLFSWIFLAFALIFSGTIITILFVRLTIWLLRLIEIYIKLNLKYLEVME